MTYLVWILVLEAQFIFTRDNYFKWYLLQSYKESITQFPVDIYYLVLSACSIRTKNWALTVSVTWSRWHRVDCIVHHVHRLLLIHPATNTLSTHYLCILCTHELKSNPSLPIIHPCTKHPPTCLSTTRLLRPTLLSIHQPFIYPPMHSKTTDMSTHLSVRPSAH